MPWCFTTDPKKRWELCDIPICKDVCKKNPCQNGGTCEFTKSGRGYRCKCKSPYSGSFCTDGKDPCMPNPCKNGGDCSNKGTDYVCACKSGYSGKTCLTKDHCMPNPCQNGGDCSKKGKRYKCTCKDGYSGKTCLIKACISNPCKNGGTCSTNGAGNKCTCSFGFAGNNCADTVRMCNLPEELCAHDGELEVDGTFMSCLDCHKYLEIKDGKVTKKTCPDIAGWGFNGYTRKCEYRSLQCFECEAPCKHTPCKNGGTCTVFDTTYECKCQHGTFGQQCQFQESSVCNPNPCQNGGLCDGNAYYNDLLFLKPMAECKCEAGWTGYTCEKCVAVFKELPNQKHPDGYTIQFANTAKACKEACMDRLCAAIDFINGKCFVHYKDAYNRQKLINDEGALHYYTMPC